LRYVCTDAAYWQRPEPTFGGQAAVQLHALLRQVLPVLHDPEAFPASYRQELAGRAEHLLHDGSEETPSSFDENEYEPGCWLDEEDPASHATSETEEEW
jgi:hypothetical protein